MSRIEDLHYAIAAVCPIDGIARDRIDFKPEATPQQRADAQVVLAAFDFRDRRPRSVPSLMADLQALRQTDNANFLRLQLAVMAVVIQQNPKLARALNIALDEDEAIQ